MDDYTRYHLQRTHDKIHSYTQFELQLLRQGMAKEIESLSLKNENFQNTKKIVAYSNLYQSVLNRLDDLEEMSQMAMEELLYHDSGTGFL